VLRCPRRWLASAITAKGRQADVDSRRRVTSLAGAAGLAFKPGHTFGELIEVGAQGLDRGIMPSLWLLLLPAARAVSNEDTPALIGNDEPLVTQDGYGVIDGHRCNPVLAGQVAPGWQLLAGRELSLRYLAAQVVGHLQVGRPGIVRVGRHPFRLRRPRSLARTTFGPGYPLRRNDRQPIVIYIDLVRSRKE
jgi:hypothetical protein